MRQWFLAEDALRGGDQSWKRGITAVGPFHKVDLSTTCVSSERLAKDLGMNYVSLPVGGNGPYPYSPATLKAFTGAVRGTDGKLLLHCTVAWRATRKCACASRLVATS